MMQTSSSIVVHQAQQTIDQLTVLWYELKFDYFNVGSAFSLTTSE
jgi:hypothetical protein